MGFPDAARIYVTQNDLAGLGLFITGLQDWIKDANNCLVKP